MELQDILEHLNQGKTIVGGSEMHKFEVEISNEAMRITAEINGSYHEPTQVRELFSKLIGQPVDETFALFPPFYTDFGKNIHIGKGVFINSSCHFQDQGGIYIGDGCLIGHNVVIATLNHDLNPQRRADTIPNPVRLGKNVWIGSNVTILGGVTIGDNSVIGAGSLVNKDIPSNVVAVGNPCKVLKPIPQDEDKEDK